MKFFQKKHSVCAECGVHFEPVTGYEARWGQFCAAHRKEPRERDEKKDAVLQWAAQNWIRLHGQMVSEYQAENDKLGMYQGGLGARQADPNNAMRNAQNALHGYNPFGGIL